MPTWSIVLLAVVVMLAAAALPPMLGARRRRRSTLAAALADARARTDAVSYRIDTADPRADTTVAAQLRDQAQAVLSVADARRSTGAVAEADRLLAEAERALPAARDRPDGRR